MPTTKGKHFDFPLTIRWRTTKQCWCFFPFESNVKSLRFWVTRSGHTQKLTINSLPVHWSLCLLCCWTRKDEKQIWLLVDVWFFPRAFFNSCGWWKPGKDKNISNQPTNQPIYREAKVIDLFWKPRRKSVFICMYMYLQASGILCKYFLSPFPHYVSCCFLNYEMVEARSFSA